LRRVVDAIFYIAQSGCNWRMLPKDFPPFTSAQYYFYLWRNDGTWEAINHVLVMQARELEGRGKPLGWRHRRPIGEDDRSGGPYGYDAGKKINGRKRWCTALARLGSWIIEIIRRSDAANGFEHLLWGGVVNVQSLGLTEIAAFPWTLRLPTKVPRRGSSSPASSCSRQGRNSMHDL
jgi:hypothetical protein